jgi:hypothetical protein
MRYAPIFIFLTATSCQEQASFGGSSVVKAPEVQELELTKTVLSTQLTNLKHVLSPEVEANFNYLRTLQIPYYQNNQLLLREHVIKSGETLNTISNLYSVHIHDIIANNPALMERESDMLAVIPVAESGPKRISSSNPYLLQNRDSMDLAAFSKGRISDKKTIYDLNPGDPISVLNQIFTKNQLQEKVYTDEHGLHKVVYVFLPNKPNPSFEIYTHTQQTNSETARIRKVVVKDSEMRVDQVLKVGSTLKEIVQKYDHPVITTAHNSMVIIPDQSKKVALVLEAFSIDWKPDGNYRMEDIPDNIRVRSIQLF